MNQTVGTQPRCVTTTVTPRASLTKEKVPCLPPTELTSQGKSLFEHFAWLYVFFRERIFRDDTERFIHALWSAAAPAEGTQLIELGCGPGFYSCQIARRFPGVSVLGVDRAPKQLRCAEEKAAELGLGNCRFKSDNVLDLSHPSENFDVVIAARLFTVLPKPKQAIAEMYRILRSGGRCVVAEPRFAFWASLPLLAMWFLARLTGMTNGFCEPHKATVLSRQSFKDLFATQPWLRLKTWQDGRYQYALCEKG